MNEQKKLIIYFPAFNEEKNIKTIIGQIPARIKGIDLVQCLVVDDGSTDNTGQTALSCGAQVIRHPVNQGVGMAFQSAVQYAWENDADYLVSMDADGQFNPVEIPLLLLPLMDDQADMVIGSRFKNGKPDFMPRIKFWGNQFIARLVSVVGGQNFRDVSCGFRAYNRESLLRLNLFSKFTYTHESILSLIYQGLRVLEIPISIRYFPGRKSRVANSITMYAVKTSMIILQVLLDYKPLRIFGSIGLASIFIGLIFFGFLIIHYLSAGSFTPYKTAGFIGLGFFIFGMLVLLLALIAEMLNRLRLNQDRLMIRFKKLSKK